MASATALPASRSATARDRRASVERVEVDAVVTCIDCGGRAHLVSYPPNDREWEPGDVLVYRCADCLDRWDIVVPDGDDVDPTDP